MNCIKFVEVLITKMLTTKIYKTNFELNWKQTKHQAKHKIIKSIKSKKAKGKITISNDQAPKKFPHLFVMEHSCNIQLEKKKDCRIKINKTWKH